MSKAEPSGTTQSERLESSGSTGMVPGLESDEDIIISMLKERGGAMMQSSIVNNSGFSKSKTSSLLNKMAEDGAIQRVRKGRENLVRLV
ncbi:MAG: hypothetical protein SCH39_11860 [Methanosarcinales archaeon]|nr:hypothetical protein [ANME-2 cluster archaeon]MDF1530757.1 hypothetical protein [ANME-2 cluster archaeon]MDW7777008.1 hypothetical protein [Methanosarcinales archaeon]